MVFAVELRFQVESFRTDSAEKDPSEDRTQALRPPLVNVVDRTMQLFPPAFAFPKMGKEFKRKAVRFDQPQFSRLHSRHRSLFPQSLAIWDASIPPFSDPPSIARP